MAYNMSPRHTLFTVWTDSCTNWQYHISKVQNSVKSTGIIYNQVIIKWIKRHVGFSQKQDISFRGFSHHPFSMSGQGTPRRSRCRFSLGEHTMNTMSLSQLIRQQNLYFCALALKLTLVKTPNAICPLFILHTVCCSRFWKKKQKSNLRVSP